jgi:hypothetical protein
MREDAEAVVYAFASSADLVRLGPGQHLPAAVADRPVGCPLGEPGRIAVIPHQAGHDRATDHQPGSSDG